MRVIGLTGGIACGKSNVSDTLRTLGAFIIDGDAIARQLTLPGGMALAALREAFGDGVFAADGSLNRRALGARVFADSQARATLDGIMQPMIRQEIQRLMAQARTLGAAVCVLDMPLLYETGLEQWCDRVWCVALPRETQLRRLMARDNLSRPEAEARVNSQLPAAEKAARAQVVIDTSGTIGYTKAMIPPLYAEEVRLALSPDEGGPHGESQSDHPAPKALRPIQNP